MFRKALVSTLLALAVTSAAWAQTPKVDFSVLFGYTLADGVSGDPYRAENGNTYDRIDPKDSITFGLSGGFYVTPGWEVGFMWRYQPTSFQVSGTTTTDLGDTSINGYHGFFAYHFGDPEGKVRPYILGGIGATSYGGFTFQAASGTKSVSGDTQFSTIWGGGLKLYPSPKVGFQVGIQWAPTYIKSDAEGWWCDPWYGCWVYGDPQYANQFEFVGGVTFRF